MELHLRFIGILLAILAAIHIAFPKRFNWGKEFEQLTLLNKQMMYVHTFFIALIILLMGVLCWTSPDDLVQTALGKKVSLGLGIFWAIRLLVQLFGYSPKLWRGKTFETIIHILFIIMWSYFAFVFLAIYSVTHVQ